MTKIGVLALQGAFAEHEAVFRSLGAACVELRCAEHLSARMDALVLPGGESTTQGKLLRDLGMFGALREKIVAGMPVFATCAGMILLSEKIEGEESPYFGTMPMTVRRNAYGRQLSSFVRCAEVNGVGGFSMHFIRAPQVVSLGKDAEPLAEIDGNIVAARYKNQFAFAFHPEVGGDARIHALFLKAV